MEGRGCRGGRSWCGTEAKMRQFQLYQEGYNGREEMEGERREEEGGGKEERTRAGGRREERRKKEGRKEERMRRERERKERTKGR